MPSPDSFLTLYFNSVVETLGLLLYSPLVEDEIRVPSTPMETVKTRRNSMSIIAVVDHDGDSEKKDNEECTSDFSFFFFFFECSLFGFIVSTKLD